MLKISNVWKLMLINETKTKSNIAHKCKFGTIQAILRTPFSDYSNTAYCMYGII